MTEKNQKEIIEKLKNLSEEENLILDGRGEEELIIDGSSNGDEDNIIVIDGRCK